MIEDYRRFLQDKAETWRKAKQLEFNSIDEIRLALTQVGALKTRNAMTLRILGLVINASSDNLVLSPAGERLMTASNKQQVLDEQLLKIYLDSYVNRHLHIPVYPLAIIFELLTKVEHVTFEEYRLFVCWIQDTDEPEKAAAFIEDFRDSDDKNQYQETFVQKVRQLGIADFDDNIYRLYAMFKLSSFIDFDPEAKRKQDTLYANSNPAVYQQLVSKVEQLSELDYEDYAHINYLGLMGNIESQHLRIAHSLSELSNEDRQVIAKQIAERAKLPDISSVEPIAVQPAILAATKREGSAPAKPRKIDYIARATRNMLVGLHGEKIAYKYEYDRLAALGRLDLALKIEHCSLEDDSLGYDISSFDGQGDTPRHIEVKTVKGSPRTFSFYISKNQLNKMAEDSHHCLYIVFNYESKTPAVWDVPNIQRSIDDGLVLVNPTNFQVTVSISDA